ncbi:MAG: hypothetical protein M1818_002014 [Claussenomyces sp. TS43310]|nr:MAG: hypothetical protein M1818_002014 [Claussenomyces sp. TS43310]
MSTFRGLMPEFPHIRVDYFRSIAGEQNPLACFLSHVHSDHLTGLENLKSPFIYCSAGTKQLLLRLERRFHHVNYELGILESHKQRYKHLSKLLRTIPLSTPTSIELAPDNEIQVTLFDANHCPGAVMFLFENERHAVLYTGDVRAEPWFVNSLSRSPYLIEYTSNMRTLDCVYLDTSFTKQELKFPPKVQGLNELLAKVAKYPPETTFHFAAWTFGYEEVWIALSRVLKCPIHVDQYKLRLYQSLGVDSHEGATLSGYRCGNTKQSGILTHDQGVRLHSCEKGIRCAGIGSETVWIRPIITRTASGREVNETGIGGGGGDLTERPELQLGSSAALQQLMQLLVNSNDIYFVEVMDLLRTGLRSSQKILSLDNVMVEADENLTLQQLAQYLNQKVAYDNGHQVPACLNSDPSLPKVITFPYSRHSSYEELCKLLGLFRPRDIYPCTVDEGRWHERSVEALFGEYCSGRSFRHDLEMRELMKDHESEYSSPMTNMTSSPLESPNLSKEPRGHSVSNTKSESLSKPNDTALEIHYDFRTRTLASQDYSHSLPSCKSLGEAQYGEEALHHECSIPGCRVTGSPQPDISNSKLEGVDVMGDLQSCWANPGEPFDGMAVHESDRSTKGHDHVKSSINATSIHSSSGKCSEASSADDDKGYGELYQELPACRQRLEMELDEFSQDFYDKMGSGHGPQDLDGVPSGMDGIGTQDPIVAEIVAQADSEISESRLADRAASFRAALDLEREGWNVSLISVGDNHSMPEVEL